MTALFLASVLSASAAVIINVEQLGADVVVSASGTLDKTGLSLAYAALVGPTWNAYPQSGAFKAGAGSMDYFSGITSTGGKFGTVGGVATAYFSAGDAIYVSGPYIGLPINYISGASLTASNTFTAASLAALGITPGTYTWAWSSDSITLNIPALAVPEPSTYAIMAGVAVLGMACWRRRRATG